MIDDGAYIFLSYQREADPDFPLRIARDLKNHGVKVWVDTLDIRGGENWENAIERAVDHCSAMIAVLSPGYGKSKWCRRELNRADSLDRRIFCILLDTVHSTDRPIPVQTTQDIDFRRWRDENVYSSRLTELLEQLANRAGVEMGPRPAPESQYLTQLIADTQASLAKTPYVDLALSVAAPRGRQSPALRSGARPVVPGAAPQRFACLEDAVRLYPRLVLLGPAGGGKTTTLRHLALEQARARRDNPESIPLPLLLDLAQWGDESTPLDFVRGHWIDASDPQPALMNGDVSLYLDGLSETEVGWRKAKQLCDWLHDDGGPKTAVVSCRLSDYGKDLDLDLPAIVVQPLDEDRIRRLANSYLQARASGFLARVVPEDEQALRNGRHLTQLATNPFLLSALLRLYQESPTADLPTNNGAIVAGLVDELWTRKGLRQEEWGPLSEMEAGFGRLALAMIEEGRPAVVPFEYALEHVGDKERLRAGASAHLIEVQGGRVRFCHPLLLEYFAAVSLQQGALEHGWLDERLTATAFAALAPGNTEGRITGKWGRVIIALSGIIGDPESLLCQVLNKNPHLAAMCIGTGVTASAATLGETARRLLEQLETTWRDFDRDGVRSAYLDRRAAVIMALGQLGSGAVPALREALKDDRSDWVRTAILESLGCIGDASACQDALSILHGAQSSFAKHSQELLKRARARVWGRIFQSRRSAERHQVSDQLLNLEIRTIRDPWDLAFFVVGETIGTLYSSHQAVRREELTDVRRAAAQALGQIGDRSVVPGLLTSLRDGDQEICPAAAQALGRLGVQHVLGDVLALLTAKDPAVRVRAVLVLATSRDDVCRWPLLTILDEEPDSAIRALAIFGLVELSEPAVIPRLRGILRDGEGQSERVAAIDGLGALRDVAAVPDLIRVVRNDLRPAEREDDRCDLRLAAVQALGSLGDPLAVPSLVELLDNKIDPPSDEKRRTELRRAAAHALGLVRDPASTEALQTALQDPSVLVQAAVALSNFETPTLVPQLVQALGGKATRGPAIAAMSEIGMRGKGGTLRSELAMALLSVLRDADRKVRLAGGEALGQVGDAAVVPHLVNALNTADWHVRRCLARTLGQIGDPAAIPTLIKLLSDTSKPLWLRGYSEEDRICDVAASALVSIGTPEALEAAEDWHKKQSTQ